MEASQDLSALQGFIEETKESMMDVENAIIELENDPANPELINTIFRPVHSMKGNSGFFKLTNINKFSHRMENLLDYIRNGEIIIDNEMTNALLTGIDYLRKMLARVEEEPSDIEMRPEEEEFLAEKIEKFQPQVQIGSESSLTEFQEKMEIALDEGVEVAEHSFLCKFFDDMQKACEYLDKIISEKDIEQIASAYDPQQTYTFEGNDYSAQLKPLGKVLAVIEQKQAVGKDLLKEFTVSIPPLKEALAERYESADIFDELKTKMNFFDDELLMGNDQFNQGCLETLNQVLAFFSPPKDEEQGALRIGEILVEQDKLSPQKLNSALAKQKLVGEILIEEGAIKKDELEEALAIQRKRQVQEKLKNKPTKESGKTIRINQSRLDSFANSIGDLYINVDAFNYLGKQLRDIGTTSDIMSRFSQTLSSLDDMVNKLQDNVMDIRRVPVKSLFQRFPRVIRELSASLEKEVAFSMVGENTIIDKDLLEKIENPLVHILRNSMDHGLETPAQRQAAEKPKKGQLKLSASVDQYYVHLTIEDDGRGIDPKKMKATAIAKGFMTEQELSQLGDKELINLIFKPGFSSAESVSSVSGRGVGMDVVMSALNETNGTINVESKVGEGTTVKITIPQTKTLVTKDALIVQAAGQQFAIPSEDITTTKYPEVFINLLAGEDGVSYNSEVLRVIDMNHFFYGHAKQKLTQDSHKVLLICQKHGVALLADMVFNHQLIVVKEFAHGYKQFRNIPGVSGYTCLGNEEIVLLTDVAKMAKESLAELTGGIAEGSDNNSVN